MEGQADITQHETGASDLGVALGYVSCTCDSVGFQKSLGLKLRAINDGPFSWSCGALDQCVTMGKRIVTAPSVTVLWNGVRTGRLLVFTVTADPALRRSITKSPGRCWEGW